MKKIFFVFTLSFLFCCSASSQTAQNTWGLGVSLVSGGAVFHVPIIFERIRVEPEISVRGSSSNTSSTDYYNSVSYIRTDANSSSSSSENISIGAGAYYSFRIDNVADWYIGPRIGLTRNSSVSDNTLVGTEKYSVDSTTQSTSINHTKQHSTSYFIGAVFGGEYYLSSHFSVGAELQVTYSNSGQPVFDEQTHTATPSPTYTSSSVQGPSSNSSFAEFTAVYIRWYF